MKILVDLTGCTKGYSYWTYASRVLSAWRDCKSLDADIILLIREEMESSVKAEYAEFEYILLQRYSCCNKLQTMFRLKPVLNSLMWRRTVNRSGCDIVFSPGTNMLLFLRVKICRVQVIHDLQPLKVWKGKKKLFFRLLTPFILKHSDRIIAISDFVKQDILKTYPFVSVDKIAVIHNGVVLPSSGLSRSLQSDSKYLLYISTLHEYKNVGTLVKAFIELKDTISHKLVVVGKSTDYWEKEILPIIVESGIQDRIVHLSHYVSDEEIARLYRSADLFISPSLYEGFGYTPVEAAMCGTPVICTRETALPEVTMGLVNYYEPALDHIALKNKIMEVLKNYPTKEQLKVISDTFKAQYDNAMQARKIYDCVAECTGGRNLLSHKKKLPLSTPF